MVIIRYQARSGFGRGSVLFLFKASQTKAGVDVETIPVLLQTFPICKPGTQSTVSISFKSGEICIFGTYGG